MFWIKFKFGKVYSKTWKIFVWSNSLKIIFIKLLGWKTSNQILNHFKQKKNEENRTTNESTWNLFVAKFSCRVLASLIFIIYIFCNIFIHKYKWLAETFSGYRQYYTLSALLNNILKGEYTPNTSLIRSSCSQIGVF